LSGLVWSCPVLPCLRPPLVVPMQRIPFSRCASQCLRAVQRPTAIRPAHATPARLLSTTTTTSAHVGVDVEPLARDLSLSSSSPPASAAQEAIDAAASANRPTAKKRQPRGVPPLVALPSPHPHQADRSVKLSALRSRLSLPPRFPLRTLARTLVHPSADADAHFNNASLSILGRHLLGNYTTEWLLCNYPRLPIAVTFAAADAYIGSKALAIMASEWGIEAAAAPGGEVDPALLQFKRIRSGDQLPAALRTQPPWKWNVTTTKKIMATDEFGSEAAPPSAHSLKASPVPMEEAAQSFVRALIGAIHLHLGPHAAQRFFRDHFLSRHLDMGAMFDFRTPTRDLSKLCAREGFEPPVARLISETGRLSRHPVFVVGVYSGKDKLGESAAPSLDEARTRAAAAALKAWYLYRPIDVTLPSSTVNRLRDTPEWRPNMIDCGEVIV
jgi:dsRNA-specific ribonuclease